MCFRLSFYLFRLSHISLFVPHFVLITLTAFLSVPSFPDLVLYVLHLYSAYFSCHSAYSVSSASCFVYFVAGLSVPSDLILFCLFCILFCVIWLPVSLVCLFHILVCVYWLPIYLYIWLHLVLSIPHLVLPSLASDLHILSLLNAISSVPHPVFRISAALLLVHSVFALSWSGALVAIKIIMYL